jgi:tRNA dimethylallyltransferase
LKEKSSSNSKNRLRAVIIFGPTAVGKTDCLDRIFPGKAEIISADCMQAYRGLDIGTAKPDALLASRLPHHLLDFKNPAEQYTAGEFVHLTEACIREISSRGLLPVVSGGTAFYLRQLVFGLPDTPPADPARRALLDRRFETEGAEAMHAELRRIDPAAAGRISVRDKYRVHRALEVWSISGRPLSSFQVADRVRQDFDFLLVGLRREREELYRRIDRRVDGMFAAGLAAEVKGLLARGSRAADPGMRAIGYREFFAMQAGCLSLDQVRQLIQRNTRRFAKRQMTFFASLPGVHWLDADDLPALAGLVEEFVRAGEMQR